MHHPPGVACSAAPAQAAADAWPAPISSAGGSGGNACERSSRVAGCTLLPSALPSGDDPLR
eukprot:8655794-Heterocapsa_arctica.AAC.1